MSSSDVREMTLHGQRLVIPPKRDWEDDRFLEDFDGLPIASEGTRAQILVLVDLARSHDDIMLSLVRPGPAFPRWYTVALVQTAGGMQRVHLERLKCPTCGWMGWSANPEVRELYAGVPDLEEALASAHRQPRVGCPACNSALPRPSIWTAAL